MGDMDSFTKLLDDLSEKTDSDWFLFTQGVSDNTVERLMNAVSAVAVRRNNACLVLCTGGGSPDGAFQIARLFKRLYQKFTVLVFGYCKSAGTLIAVGADELVMSHAGHLGPLDIQLADKDEFAGQTAALDVQQALKTLSETTINSFIDFFIKLEPGKSLSTKTAGELAKGLALGIVSPIASHVDPLLIGRVDRSMRIAKAYIDRLSPELLAKDLLVGGYPSHEFVIDFEEAKKFFGARLREPSAEETQIEGFLRGWGNVPRPADFIGMISTEKKLPPVPPSGEPPSSSAP